MKMAARHGPWAVDCSAEGAGSASTLVSTREFATAAGDLHLRMGSGGSRAGAPRSALRARGPYPAPSAGGRAADPTRPGGHHEPPSLNPAGTATVQAGIGRLDRTGLLTGVSELKQRLGFGPYAATTWRTSAAPVTTHAPWEPAASNRCHGSVLRYQPTTRPEARSTRSRMLPPWRSWEYEPTSHTAPAPTTGPTARLATSS